MDDIFNTLPKRHFGVLLVDPPWPFRTWSDKGKDRSAENHYKTMSIKQIAALPVGELAADKSVLLLWVCWPSIKSAFDVIVSWGFVYKTCAFSWMKADPYRLFADENTPFMGGGYWTRSNTEVCLLATRGKPKRIKKDVRQGIIAPRREHSRKPDEIYPRIERLLAGPYLDLFGRQSRQGWTVWGDQKTKFDKVA